ncbi:hypothetical protein U1Q18_020317, partial [Sarracenia purpurea var. burkii]
AANPNAPQTLAPQLPTAAGHLCAPRRRVTRLTAVAPGRSCAKRACSRLSQACRFRVGGNNPPPPAIAAAVLAWPRPRRALRRSSRLAAGEPASCFASARAWLCILCRAIFQPCIILKKKYASFAFPCRIWFHGLFTVPLQNRNHTCTICRNPLHNPCRELMFLPPHTNTRSEPDSTQQFFNTDYNNNQRKITNMNE